MLEYEIYVPSLRGDGAPLPETEMDRIKSILTKAFGGYTHLKHRSEGAWRMGGVTFRDEVTLLRVLDEGESGFDMPAFKQSLEEWMQQESVLIVAREVRTV